MSDFSTWVLEKKLLLQAKKGEVGAAKSLMRVRLRMESLLLVLWEDELVL